VYVCECMSGRLLLRLLKVTLMSRHEGCLCLLYLCLCVCGNDGR
jgi:hypothetical protein